MYKSIQDATDRVIKEVQEVNPIAANAEIYKKAYEIYRSLYRDLKDDFSKLNSIV
jgi:xylulokinase